MAPISGYGGFLDWDGFRISVKDWRMNWNTHSDYSIESWVGRIVISRTDYYARMNEKAKFGPVSDTIPNHAIPVSLEHGSVTYCGNLQVIRILNLGPSGDPIFEFKGNGSLMRS